MAFLVTATAKCFNGIFHFGNARGNAHIEIYSPFQNVKWIHSSTDPDEKKIDVL